MTIFFQEIKESTREKPTISSKQNTCLIREMSKKLFSELNYPIAGVRIATAQPTLENFFRFPHKRPGADDMKQLRVYAYYSLFLLPVACHTRFSRLNPHQW